MTDLAISPKAVHLILEAEGFAPRLGYPGGQSGPTAGYGYDFAYHTPDEIADDWARWFDANTLARLAACSGQYGSAKARRPVANMADIVFTREASLAVFTNVDVPRWARRAEGAFGGRYNDVGDDVQGALLSLVFNRGVRMDDKYRDPINERREMRVIRDTMYARNLLRWPYFQTALARAFRDMRRLWTGRLPAPYNVKLGGLVKRRDAEAALIETAEMPTQWDFKR